MKINRPSSQIIVVTKERLTQAVFLAVTVVFIVIWYFFLLRALGPIPNDVHIFEYIRTRLSQEPELWLFVLAPLILIPDMIKRIKVVLLGEELTFNGITRTMQRNQKRVATFNEIKHLQIRTIRGDAEEHKHRLTAVLRNGNKIQIHTDSDLSSIIALADDIADILEVEVIRK